MTKEEILKDAVKFIYEGWEKTEPILKEMEGFFAGREVDLETVVSEWVKHKNLNCAFCGKITHDAYTSRIPPHEDVPCCDECFEHKKSEFDGF